LNVDSIDAPELVEVVHVVSADIGIEHREDVVDSNALGLGALAIDVDEDLRGICPKGAEDAHQFGPCVCRNN